MSQAVNIRSIIKPPTVKNKGEDFTLGKFNFIKTEIDGVIIVEPPVFGDERGYFIETYNYEDFKAGGIDTVFVQDNQSKSRKGVLRGLHFQKNHPQGKLVRVISGEVLDVAVDLRRSSETFGKWVSVILSAENKRQLFVPRGFAHGFLVQSDAAEFVYKCDDYYHPEDEGGLLWNDPNVGVDWKLANITPILSEKDKNNHLLGNFTFE